jgi:hypothetical protein
MTFLLLWQQHFPGSSVVQRCRGSCEICVGARKTTSNFPRDLRLINFLLSKDRWSCKDWLTLPYGLWPLSQKKRVEKTCENLIRKEVLISTWQTIDGRSNRSRFTCILELPKNLDVCFGKIIVFCWAFRIENNFQWYIYMKSLFPLEKYVPLVLSLKSGYV